ncbi:MAG: LysR family transcriptional regulator [SAR202 cluster bacterium]|nr:LysR family transcriptional regulator [SAR202 cluster bacterium]
MELAQLEAFVEAATRGSFHRAARALYVSQPSVSARVRALEDELGGPLFHRHGRGVRLTDTGRRFLPYAQQALDALDEGKELMRTAMLNQGGVLKIAAARGIGTYTLPGILEVLRERHPEIKPHIAVGRSRDVLGMVVTEEAQVGLARELTHPDIVSAQLYDEEIVLVTHPKHRFANREDVDIAEVAREPFILYDPGSAYFLLIERVCREAGIVPRVEMRLDSVDATKRMVELGLGISFLPRSGIRREADQGSLSVIPLAPEYRVTLPTCVLVRRQQHYSPSVLALLRVLEDMYDKEIPFIQRAGAA